MKLPPCLLYLRSCLTLTLSPYENDIIASPSIHVILTLNEVKGKNLQTLRVNSVWQSLGLLRPDKSGLAKTSWGVIGSEQTARIRLCQ